MIDDVGNPCICIKNKTTKNFHCLNPLTFAFECICLISVVECVDISAVVELIMVRLKYYGRRSIQWISAHWRRLLLNMPKYGMVFAKVKCDSLL